MYAYSAFCATCGVKINIAANEDLHASLMKLKICIDAFHVKSRERT